jgi:small subunit ribosomal protein S16
MLAIRMQRTGRKGHAMFRIIVQESRRTPTSGKIVALLGSYDPHTKDANLEKDKAAFYLSHGAQPSDRVIKILISEGVSLPKWVTKPDTHKKRSTRNIEKLRRNRPNEPDAPVKEPEASEKVPIDSQPEADGTPSSDADTNKETANDSESEKTPLEPKVDKPAENT